MGNSILFGHQQPVFIIYMLKAKHSLCSYKGTMRLLSALLLECVYIYIYIYENSLVAIVALKLVS